MDAGVATVGIDESWARRNLVVCCTAEDEMSATARTLRDSLVGYAKM